jgi:uncharacterized protein (DUF58 family)
MTVRFWTLLLVILMITIAGLGGMQGKFLLLTVPLVVYLLFSIKNSPLEARMRAERTMGARIVHQDSPVTMKVVVSNDGPALDECLILDPLPSGLKISEGEARKLLTVLPGEQLENRIVVTASRGRFGLHRISVIAQDHFGLFARRLELPTTGDLQVLPVIPHLRNLKILPRQTRSFSGPIPARLGGSGMIFWGVREFQTGDALRQINWKKSSHYTQNLFTNEFEQERIADVGLILDARTKTNLTSGQFTLFEYSILAAAALAEAFLFDGHRVSLLIYGYGMERVYPGYGKIQREMILQALAGAEPGSNLALEDFSHLPVRLFPAQSQLVVVSPISPRDYFAYLRLRKNGYDVMVVSPNPIDFEASFFQDVPELPQAIRLAKVERELWLRKLARLGVQVIDWPVDSPLDFALRANLYRQPVIRRNPRMILT